MKIHFSVDDRGKITSTGIWDQSETLPPGAIICDLDTHHAIKKSSGLLRWDGTKFSFPHDDLRIWKSFISSGSYTGVEAVTILEELQELKRFSDLPLTIDLNQQPFFKRPNTDKSFSIPDVDGLKARSFDVEKDFDAVFQASVENNIHKEDEWKEFAARLEDIGNIQFLHELNGQPIHFEIYQAEGDKLHITRTMHLSKGRPYWFWREIMKPIFQHFADHGTTELNSLIVTDYTEWVDSLKTNYKAQIVPVKDKVWKAKYPLDMSIFTGWPARKTHGLGWRIDQSDVLVKEGTAADLADVRAAIDNSWDQTTLYKDRALQMLDEWWTLDKATLLLGYAKNKLADVRMIRHRADKVSASTALMRLDQEVAPIVDLASFQWQAEHGYQTATIFVDAALYGVLQKFFANRGWQKLRDLQHPFITRPLVELTLNLADTLEKRGIKWSLKQ